MKKNAISEVSFQIIADVQSTQILREIASPEINQDVVKLEKVPKIIFSQNQTALGRCRNTSFDLCRNTLRFGL